MPGAAIAASVTVKGKLVGATKLLNQVWNEAKEAKSNRFTFREPSPTVRADVRALTSYLPKEVCVAALGSKGAPMNAPLRVVVAGGRTSPVTLVVAEGQQILFDNQDPFPHKLYDTQSKGLQAVETAAGKSRTWTPPGPGKYEIRDQLAPSVRSWIVVESRTVAVGFPDRLGNFAMDLQPGTYTLRGYHNGEAVGVELPITVTPAPAEQLLRETLKVAEPDTKAKEK
ncbi:uncharacterized protein CMC5_004200 [Chondromyces crocatus]|uniref:Uncharacterized protein n=2 Tax=Chondromyces crocatus TaxID=52 RepID=A0A0K1E5Z6_CHOCO|nr:uncharacterized protein CMC5_004200 [Chondromyces crocatus]